MSEEATLDEFVEDESEVDGEFIETAAGQLPVDWDTKNVDELCALRNGKATNHTEIGEQQFLVYGSNGPIGSYSESNFDGGLIFGRVGAVGEVERVREPVWVSDNAIQASVTDKCNTDFLYYFLSNKELSSLATKTAQPLLNQSTIGNVTVPSPPLPEQRKIATVLYTVDRAIEKTEEVCNQITRIKSGVVQDLFSTGYNKVDSDSEWFGPVPSEWDVVRLGEISDVTKLAGYEYTNDFNYDEDGDIIAIRALNLKENRLNLDNEVRYITKENFDDLERSQLSEGDVAMTYVGAYIGESGYIPESNKYTLGPNVAKISPNERLLGEYLHQAIQTKQLKTQIVARQSTTGQPALSMGKIRKLEIPLPSLEEQQKIIEVLQDFDRQYRHERNVISQYVTLKRGLMQDLLSGTVRTTDTNIEVPEEIAQYG